MPAMQAPTPLPLETKRALRQRTEAKSPSSQSSTSAGESHHSEQYIAEEALTPSILYPSTPTPTTLYDTVASFDFVMWPAPPAPERRRLKLRSCAEAFIPKSCQTAAEPAALVEEPSAATVADLQVEASFTENLEAEALASNVAALASEAREAELEEKLPSQGSKLHGSGECKPCAWLWKERGCANGKECVYCHLCPAGELKKRKKAKVQAIRAGCSAVDSHGRWRSD